MIWDSLLSRHLVFRKQHVWDSLAANEEAPHASALSAVARLNAPVASAHLMVKRCPDSGHTRTPSSMCT